MKHALIMAAGFAALLTLGACAQSDPVASSNVGGHSPAAPVMAAAAGATTPASPRAECARTNVTLYFGEQVASDEPVVTPLLNDFMARIRACEAAGGELRGITIVTSADPGQNVADSRAQVHRRIERVRAALVNVGAPADKISEGVAAPAAPVMGRRAEITADLY